MKYLVLGGMENLNFIKVTKIFKYQNYFNKIVTLDDFSIVYGVFKNYCKFCIRPFFFNLKSYKI